MFQDRKNKAFIEAVLRADFGEATRLLNKGADINATLEKTGRTALLAVIECGESDAEVLKRTQYLFDKGARLDLTFFSDETILMLAIKYQKTATADFLIDVGADINVKGDGFLKKYTPLIMAIETRQSALALKILNERADPNEAGDYDIPLVMAVKTRQIDVIERLLLNGADVNLRRGMNSYTPLMQAISDGHSDIVDRLLKAGATDVHFAANKNALMMAVSQGHAEITKKLLDAGVDPFTKNDQGKTALDFCTNLDCRALLEEKMAQLQKKDIAPAAEVKSVDQNPDVVTLVTSLDNGFSLQEVFNFKSRERLTFVVGNNTIGTPVRDRFDDIHDQQSVLRPAFDEHVRRGGLTHESVIDYKAKRKVDLGDFEFSKRAGIA